MKIITIIGVFILISCSSNTGKEVISKRVSLAEFKEIMARPEIQLVDVRTENEYLGGFIDNARNIDFLKDDFISQCQEQLDKSQPIAIYCASGGRSSKALKKLKENDFREVYELGVGYQGYR